MTDGRTHHDGCWRYHLDCAVRRVEEYARDLVLVMGRYDGEWGRHEATRALLDRALGLLREGQFCPPAAYYHPRDLRELHRAWNDRVAALLRDAGDGEEG